MVALRKLCMDIEIAASIHMPMIEWTPVAATVSILLISQQTNNAVACVYDDNDESIHRADLLAQHTPLRQVEILLF